MLSMVRFAFALLECSFFLVSLPQNGEDTSTRWEKYPSKLGLYRSFVRIFAFKIL